MDPHSFISRKSIESIDFNTWQVLPSQIVKGGIESIDFKTFSKKCAKSYFEQLSHSMSVSKMCEFLIAEVIMTVVTCIHVTLTVEEQGSCLKQL